MKVAGFYFEHVKKFPMDKMDRDARSIHVWSLYGLYASQTDHKSLEHQRR